jgi:hypothetical protein
MAPVTLPGGIPVTDVPGLTPRFPKTTEAPVLVTADPARMPKPIAVPRLGGDGELADTLWIDWELVRTPRIMSEAMPNAANVFQSNR